jgi:hypothetical protein
MQTCTGPTPTSTATDGSSRSTSTTAGSGYARTVALYRGPDSPEEDRERWAAVLAGYQQVRPLSQSEVAGFPVLAACRAMWDIGDWLGAVNRTGDAWVTDSVIARLLAEVGKAEVPSDLGRSGLSKA